MDERGGLQRHAGLTLFVLPELSSRLAKREVKEAFFGNLSYFVNV